MAAGAQADELSNLKAQLESLQARVNTLETRPAPTMPEGQSLITFHRGQGSFADKGLDSKRDMQPSDRGFTVAVTPTADMPAPVAEIVVYGYVKGDVIYDTKWDAGFTFAGGSTLWSHSRRDHGDHIRLNAKQTRFGIRSKVDTAIGQIRTKIEMDMYGNNHWGGGPAVSGSAGLDAPRLRHAYGEWDITPNWTLLVGQTWYTAALSPIGISTVDFSGPAGPSYSRRPQVRMSYHDGPLSWAVAIEKPTYQTHTAMPNVASYFQYDLPGGHQFIVTGDVSDYSDAPGSSSNRVGWAVQAGANVNLADIAYLTTGVVYGYGEPQNLFCVGCAAPAFTLGGKPAEALGFMVGLQFSINDTTSFNTAFGYFKNVNNVGGIGAPDRNMTVHANIMWKPVSQMQMGWEVMWGEARLVGGAKRHDIRAQFGTWFFF
jgi:hypothetical protein